MQKTYMSISYEKKYWNFTIGIWTEDFTPYCLTDDEDLLDEVFRSKDADYYNVNRHLLIKLED